MEYSATYFQTVHHNLYRKQSYSSLSEMNWQQYLHASVAINIEMAHTQTRILNLQEEFSFLQRKKYPRGRKNQEYSILMM